MMESVREMGDGKKSQAMHNLASDIEKQDSKPVVTLNSDIFADVDVLISATLGHGSMPIRQLLKLAAGDVVELETPLDGHLDITLNGKIIARGELVAVDDKFGVRISEIIPN
jgi:flagellar motor switch protein FliN